VGAEVPGTSANVVIAPTGSALAGLAVAKGRTTRAPITPARTLRMRFLDSSMLAPQRALILTRGEVGRNHDIGQ